MYAAGALAGAARSMFGAAAQPSTAVNFAVPAHACDCHTHIFGDPAKFPFASTRTYTPEAALPQEMAALHRALHIERVVIVTPSVYATDNATTISGIQVRGKNARGVAVIGDTTSDRELDALHAAWIRGIRLNLATAGPTDPTVGRERFRAALARLGKRAWLVAGAMRH
jgi:predicted TIM-barrel fold metal-dependent hydrolase